MNTVKKPMYEWKDIPWRKLERANFKLQKRIYKASQRGDSKLVRRLQKLLIKSWASKCLAVRRVTQENQGKRTAGIDGIKSLSPNERIKLVNKLELSGKAKPTRRVWIPKPNSDSKRPLGIPIMKDRATQALAKMALEPEWEAKFDPDSYGFRPGRSSHDAIAAIFLNIKQGNKFVLDADISKCFDRINHDKLIREINTYPTLRRQIKAWLKSGVMDGKKLFATNEGTPQGGIISPLLANIALDGLSKHLKNEVIKIPHFYKTGLRAGIRDRLRAFSVIRYADDFLLIHSNLEILERMKEKTEIWLKEWGLELNPDKTKICNTLMEHEGEKPGFNFLGFHIQQMKTGKYTSGKNLRGESLGFKTIITPSKESVLKHFRKLAEIINSNQSTKQIGLIKELNKVIRGWCNYYSHVISKKTFNKLDHLITWNLLRWSKRRHPGKSSEWRVNKYFHRMNNRAWNFAYKDGEEWLKLIQHSDTKITRHIKVKGEASPLEGNLSYWGLRLGSHPGLSNRKIILLKKQKGICKHCNLNFRDGDILEVDHIIPKSKGGKGDYKNLQLLHLHCHDEKTRHDGSNQRV